ncbi:hypothetical protein GCM10007320_13730 [Pseudorhodoferax aquiterrae]|uniref:Uncharacterized protein n=1 Tax=Pseudorhodoferax aquiterrae TaxID=747304 RepID=A0ABQ3FYS1_9BURK|nr:hypothetical protein GCM10007320_13730 [Pseudorhodoferax aquiterrae]
MAATKTFTRTGAAAWVRVGAALADGVDGGGLAQPASRAAAASQARVDRGARMGFALCCWEWGRILGKRGAALKRRFSC